MMEFTNYFTKHERAAAECDGDSSCCCLSPFAPHMAEELWQALGHEKSLAYEPWPEFDPALAKEDTVEIPVQINGKVRVKITVPADADQATWKRRRQCRSREIAELSCRQADRERRSSCPGGW